MRAANLHLKPFSVNRHWYHARASRQQRSARPKITGIFQPDHIARVKQYARDQINALLCACDNDDLFGGAVNAARRPKIGGDCRGAAMRQVDADS